MRYVKSTSGRNRRRLVYQLVLSEVLLISGVCAFAQDLTPSEVIEHRIASFREIGTAYKAINDELKGRNPNIAVIQESARQIKSLGSQIPSWFPPGTGPAEEPEMGLIDTILSWFSSESPVGEEGKTNAKAVVWTKRPEFENAYRKFKVEAGKMEKLTQSSDKAAVAAQFKSLAATCNGCHDTFREKVDE